MIAVNSTIRTAIDSGLCANQIIFPPSASLPFRAGVTLRWLEGLTFMRRSKIPEYSVWCGIKHRTTNPQNWAWKWYGGRGIKMCEQWLNSFDNFLNDVGYRPSPKHTIDRINNDGNYEPGNVRWATREEQHNNTSRNAFLTYGGETKTKIQWARQWASESGVALTTIRSRIAAGKKQEDMTRHHRLPGSGLFRVCKELTFDGKTQTVIAWAKELGYKRAESIHERLRDGEPLSKVLVPMRPRNHFLTYQGKTQTIAAWAREVGLNPKTLLARVKKGGDIAKILGCDESVELPDL